MFKLLRKEVLTPSVRLYEVEAPAIARKALPGQFIILMVDEKGERTPFSIADWDQSRGSVSIVVNQVGLTTGKLSQLEAGDSIAHFAGPLGRSSEIAAFGNIACVAIGYGTTAMIPIARALRGAGNRIFSIVSAQTRSDLFLTDALSRVSDSLQVTTSDGSAGDEGWVIEPLRKLLSGTEPISRVIVIGPLCMMKLVSAATQEYKVKTVASLNPVMVDGTGMCGACRVIVDGKSKFACVDGLEFDGHALDWDNVMSRRCTYPIDLNQTVAAYRCQNCAQW
jgi:ferredoxin/flavodoxin---NADP+ reductase